MRNTLYGLLGCALIGSGVALAKLPPPTPEELAAAAEKKAKQEEQLEKEKAQLERAQDRVVARYRKEHPGGGSRTAAAGSTPEEKLPKTAKELPSGVGPKPDMPQSAEAHSGHAK